MSKIDIDKINTNINKTLFEYLFSIQFFFKLFKVYLFMANTVFNFLILFFCQNSFQYQSHALYLSKKNVR